MTKEIDTDIDSKTWGHVLKFAEVMEAKLEQNRHKGDREGWLKDSPESLLYRLAEEVGELRGALRVATTEGIISECADVANFAMMIADVVQWREEKEGGNS